MGKWNQSGLTWTNHERNLMITFPNDKWKVFSKPTHEIIEKNWRRPREKSKIGDYLLGVDPIKKSMFTLIILA